MPSSNRKLGGGGGGGAPTDAQYWVGAADGTLSAEKNLGAFTGIVLNTAGVPTAADPALGYVSPSKTANVASATTLPAIPETGLLVPVTGTTQIDFITKPTGDAPRFVCLWFQSAITVRNNVSGAGAGAANIRMMQGAAANQVSTFAADSFLLLVFDGTVWRKADDAPHWDGTAVVGSFASSKVLLNSSIGAQLLFVGGGGVACDSVGTTLSGGQCLLNTRPKLVNATVASASAMTFTAGAPLIDVSGTTTINTAVSTGWTTGMMLWLRFADVLTVTHNSGGACDFLAKDGANITTSAGMVLGFVFDGTDFREVGR